MAKRKPRKALTKKIRFEVFKRDSFICQYCGQSAPEVVLHADHIEPVSKGGDDNIMNLVTACIDCNQGKGARRLSDKSVVKMAKKQADETQARLEQIQMMAEWQKGLTRTAGAECKVIDDLFFLEINERNGSQLELNEFGRKDVKRLLKKFGFDEVLVALEISKSRYLKTDSDDLFTFDSMGNALEKLGGICWNRKYRDSE